VTAGGVKQNVKLVDLAYPLQVLEEDSVRVGGDNGVEVLSITPEGDKLP